jgi:hypothetical protein
VVIPLPALGGREANHQPAASVPVRRHRQRAAARGAELHP